MRTIRKRAACRTCRAKVNRQQHQLLGPGYIRILLIETIDIYVHKGRASRNSRRARPP
jgi:hypothetical protein